MNQSCPKILLLPAWYPASFFKDQMELLSDQFEFRVLLGNRVQTGKKKVLKNFLNGQRLKFKTTEKDGFVELNYSYVNHLTEKLEKHQIEKLSGKIGDIIVQLFNGNKPDLIHIQSISDTAVFVCNWAKRNDIPVILTEHIIYVRRKFDYFQKEIERVYSQVDKVLCVSNYVYRNLLTHSFTMKSVEVVGNMINDDFVSKDLNAITKNNKIIFVAAHFHDKDVDLLLDLMTTVKSKHKNLLVDVFGLDEDLQYSPNETLKNELKRRGLSNSIRIKGKIIHSELLKIYSQYSLLLSTSFSETFGLSIAESIAYGTPVICTDSGGLHDFVNEKNGIIVPIRNLDRLIEAINLILSGNQSFDYKKISLEICERYGKKSFKHIMGTLYRNLIDKK